MENQEKKQCPQCKTEISAEATRCPHCQGDLRNWFVQHKITATILGVIAASVVWGVIYNGFIRNDAITAPVSNNNSLLTPVLSETECRAALNEISAVVEEKPTTKSQVTRDLLEQYAVDAGLSVAKTNDRRYVLPQSDCGRALGGLLITVVEGAK